MRHHKWVNTRFCMSFGGAERDRTADLDVANVALSQLSYGPPGKGADTVRSRGLSQALRAVGLASLFTEAYEPMSVSVTTKMVLS